MTRLYGNLQNRLEENKNYSGKELHEGMDITMYYWSDRHCYFITKVVNQKHIFVKEYEVVADQEKAGGMGHQNWLYFKSVKECNEYLKKFGKGTNEEVFENQEQEWMFRYGHWYQVRRYNKALWEKCLENAKKDAKAEQASIERIARFYFRLNDEEFAQVMAGKEIVKYQRITQGISFGIKDYYYDWEF